MVIKIRKRIFVAVEGEGEQSFIKWLQQLADENHLAIHLDCCLLGGGGYRSMLTLAEQELKRSKKTRSTSNILLVDSDRGLNKDDGWSLDKLRIEAKKKGFQVCIQSPNQEGLLFRMFSGKERTEPNVRTVDKQLIKEWPEYEKPIDALMLASKFKLADLLRVAKVDIEINSLLSIIGLNLN